MTLSGSWEGKIRRKKEFAKSNARSAKEQMDAEDLALSILTTRVQGQLRRKGLAPGELAATFHQLDCQKSGKLDMNEVTRAFKTLQVSIAQSDLDIISKAFVQPSDGYLDYWKLLQHLVPIYRPRKGNVSPSNAARALNHGAKSPGVQKPCYDPAWVSKLGANQEFHGDLGTRLQAFNSGRPINYSPSKYLRDPPSKFGMQPDPCPLNGGIHNLIHQTGDSTPAPSISQQPAREPDYAATEPLSRRNSLDISPIVTREVPVLSGLPEPALQPSWVNRDSTFQNITRSEAKEEVRGRAESMFSELKKPPSEFGPVGDNATSVPIIYKLKGMKSYESKPLPFGGPFWSSGFAEPEAEDLAPQPKTPKRAGPLPLGDSFWSGGERPHSAPRISLRRDYPVPPLFSDINSEVNLRKAGQKEKVLRTWVDTIGQGPSAITYVGEGEQVLSQPGLHGGSSFTRPRSAVLPHKEEHPSTWKSSGDHPEISRPQKHTLLAHSCLSSDWAPESFALEKGRPQTVNSVARGSPAENLLSSNRPQPSTSPLRQSCPITCPISPWAPEPYVGLEGGSRPQTLHSSISLTFSAENPLSSHPERKLVSAMKRPSSAQSATSSVRSGVTFSPFPSRSCTPSSRSSQADHTLHSRVQTRSQQLHKANSRRTSTTLPVSTKRLQAQLREEKESVRLLV